MHKHKRPKLPREGSTAGEEGKGSVWPDGAAALLRKCWSPDAGERPSFSTVHSELTAMRPAFEQIKADPPQMI